MIIIIIRLLIVEMKRKSSDCYIIVQDSLRYLSFDENMTEVAKFKIHFQSLTMCDSV